MCWQVKHGSVRLIDLTCVKKYIKKSIEQLMEIQSDFKNEVTVLQYHTSKLRVFLLKYRQSPLLI